MSSERGDYRSIYCSFWDDEDVHALSHLEYRILTTLRGTLPPAGIGVVYRAQLAQRCSVTVSEVDAALALLASPRPNRSVGWVQCEGAVVWIVDALRYEPSLSPKNSKHRANIRDRQLAPFGTKPIAEAFRRHYREWFQEWVSHDSGMGIPESGFPSPVHPIPSHPNPVQPLIDEDLAPEIVQRIGEPRITATWLTIWANRAIIERWGEQTNPLSVGAPAQELAAELIDAKVDWQIVRLSIYRQCRESKSDRPFKTVKYFTGGILQDCSAELSRRTIAAAGESPPPASDTAKAPRRGPSNRPSSPPVKSQYAAALTRKA